MASSTFDANLMTKVVVPVARLASRAGPTLHGACSQVACLFSVDEVQKGMLSRYGLMMIMKDMVSGSLPPRGCEPKERIPVPVQRKLRSLQDQVRSSKLLPRLRFQPHPQNDKRDSLYAAMSHLHALLASSKLPSSAVTSVNNTA